MKYFVLILICAAINSLDDTNDEYRRYYGLSFHRNCGNYAITFKCLTACKSMGYQVFRLDFKCKCSCHELKTTTFLPALVWRTNGTTKRIPSTFSPRLYDIVGTMSPFPTEDTGNTNTVQDSNVGVNNLMVTASGNLTVTATDNLTAFSDSTDTSLNTATSISMVSIEAAKSIDTKASGAEKNNTEAPRDASNDTNDNDEQKIGLRYF